MTLEPSLIVIRVKQYDSRKINLSAPCRAVPCLSGNCSCGTPLTTPTIKRNIQTFEVEKVYSRVQYILFLYTLDLLQSLSRSLSSQTYFNPVSESGLQ